MNYTTEQREILTRIYRDISLLEETLQHETIISIANEGPRFNAIAIARKGIVLNYKRIDGREINE